MSRPALVPAPAALLQLVTGRWISGCISLVAKLGVADELADGPKSAEDIAKKLQVQPQALYRVLRALASVGVFVEEDAQRFGNTPLSETLRTGPHTLRAFAIMVGEPPMARAIDELSYAVKTGAPAFDHVNQATLFEYIRREPDFARVFSEAMTSRSTTEVGAVLEAFDFGGVSTLVDVAGGHGFFLASILAKNPSQKGILFDMPEVVGGARAVFERAGVVSRCEITEGDFFQSVPSGADGYILKHILHDWDDASCVKILKNIQAASSPGARLFVVEAVIEPDNLPHPGKLLDVQMLVVAPGGRERTRPEWEQVLSAGGFALSRIVGTSSMVSVLEATRC